MKLLPPSVARAGRPRALWGTALLAVAVLLAAARGAAANGDPVEDFRQALKPDRLPTDKAGYDARKKALLMKADKLASIVDLSRAIVLSEWRYTDSDADLRRVDLDVFKSITDRFESEFKTRLASNRPGQRVAAIILAGEMAAAASVTKLGLDRGVEARRLLAKNIVQDLASVVDSTDAAVRAATARALGRILANTRDDRGIIADPEAVFGDLRKLWDSKDARVRLAVANALGDFLRVFSEQQADPKDTATIEQRDLDVIAGKVIPFSFEMLKVTDLAVRRRSLDTMQRFTELMARRLRPEEGGTRPVPGGLEARRQLRGLRSKLEQFNNYEAQLGQLLHDADFFLRGRTLRLLEDLAAIRSNVRAGGGGADMGDKPDDKRWFEKLFQTVMLDLLSNLEQPARTIRLTVVETLENLGPDAHAQAPVLIKSLADPDPIVRWATARALKRIDGTPVPGEIEALARTLSDRDLSVRVAAATTLEAFGPQAAAAVPELLRAVSEGDVDARIAAVRALGAIRKEGKQVVPVVARALAHPDRRVRRAAAETIGRFGADAALAAGALERAVRDADPEVRRLASEAALNIPPR